MMCNLLGRHFTITKNSLSDTQYELVRKEVLMHETIHLQQYLLETQWRKPEYAHERIKET